MERQKNAPVGVFDFYPNDSTYKGYEDNTYDWEVERSEGDFTLYTCFDTVAWGTRYCACYKDKAYAYSGAYWTVRDIHDSSVQFVEFLRNFK